MLRAGGGGGSRWVTAAGMACKADAERRTEGEGPGRIFSKTHQFSDVRSSKYEAVMEFEKGELKGGKKKV